MTRVGKLKPGDRFVYNNEGYVVTAEQPQADMHGPRRVRAALEDSLFPSWIELHPDTAVTAVPECDGEEDDEPCK